MKGRRVIAVFFIALGSALLVWALVLSLGLIDQTALGGFIFPGLVEGSPVMFLVLGAATVAFGLVILIATLRRRE